MENIALIDSFSEFKDMKSIDRVTLMSILEEVFRAALNRKFGSDENFDIIINPDKGDLEIWRNRVVVADDEVEDDNEEIELSVARKIEPDFEIGEDVSEEVKLYDLGRRAILALRQNLISKIQLKEKIKCVVPIIGITIDLIISRLGLSMEDLGQGNIYLEDADRIEILKPLLEDFKVRYNLLKPSEKLIFPSISNVHFNREIKIVMQKIGVDTWVTYTNRGKNKTTIDVPKYSRISAHTARRTYITHNLRKGVLPDVVMSTTGHKKVQTMSSYHKYDPASISREMRKKIKN